MTEETARIRGKLKKCMHALLGTYGNKGTNMEEFCKEFLDSWYENLLDYAHRLGFSTQNPAHDLLNLLKTFPEQVIVNELPDGTVHLRPVATDDIKENLALIDKTNKEMDKIKYIKESQRAKQRGQMNLPNPNMIPVQNQPPPPAMRLAQFPPAHSVSMVNLSAMPPPGFHQIPPPQAQFPPSSAWAIIGGQQQIPNQPPPQRFPSMPPPRQPQHQQQLRPVYQRNQQPPPPRKAQPQSVPPPNLPGGSKNANSVPLGPVRRPFVGTRYSGQDLINILQQQQQRSSSNSSKQNGYFSASNHNNNARARPVVNDFGDVVAQQPKTKNKIEINIRQQPASSSSSSNGQQQPKMMNGHIGESKKWANEDFRVPPSNEASAKGSLVGSRERIDIWAEPSDDEDENEAGGDEMYFDSESEWECPVEMDREWAEDNEECTAFIDEMQQWAPTIPSDLYRLIHLFRLNDGVYSSAKMEKLQSAYSNAFHADLTTKEWNRLLGNEETIKIVKDRFKRCKWPASEMFKIVEKTSSYEIQLLRALTDAVADPAIFVRQNANAPSSSSASAAPTPSSRPRSQVQPSPISSIAGGGGAHQMQSPTTSGRNSSSLPPPPPSSLPSPMPSSLINGGGQGTSTNSKDFDQFAELAIFAQQLLFKAKNGPRKPLNQLFDRIKAVAHPQQFSPILLGSETAFLGYLRLFSESFRIEFQGDGIFVTAMDFQPNSQNCTIPTDSSLFYNNSDLHRGERHKVMMVEYKSPAVPAALQLSQIFKNLQGLLSEYKQILEDICEPPFMDCLPNQRVFFLDGANHSLCRGQFIRTDGEERAIIRDIDNGRERYILRKHVFQLPTNFPNWRFPSCHFSAKFIDVDEAKLKQLWSQANCEFTVDIVEVLPNFCRVRLAADQ